MPDVRMNYETMRQMTTAFNEAKTQLEEIQQAAKKQGSEMEAGALQGQAGETFRAAINGPLTKALQDLAGKMGELAEDVDKARAELEEGVKDAKGRFQN
ncbi:MAG TPA: WXG100 family type VII secretion target [Anaerolineales bacterium]|nr:WXG100 family type VII secretion target [Anaerolineales bacterium]